MRIIDERDLPQVRPSIISLEGRNSLLSAEHLKARGLILSRTEDLKAALLNGCLLDLLYQLDLPRYEDSIAKIKGTHPTYNGQYLEVNFCPEIDDEFRTAWQERHRWKHPRGEKTYEDTIVVSESPQVGWWIIRLEKSPNI